MLRKVTLVVTVVGAAAALGGCGYSSPAAVEKQLAAEIPVGSDKDKVIAFLDANEFEHSGRYRPELYYDKNRTISASAPQKKYGLLVTGKIYVTFTFDQQDRLVSYRAEEVLTGP